MGVSGQVKPFSNPHALVASKFFFCSSYKYTTLLAFSSVSNLPFLSNYAWCFQQHISKTFSFSFRYHLWLCPMFFAYIYTYICCDPFINPFYWSRCIFFEEQFERFIILIKNYFFPLYLFLGRSNRPTWFCIIFAWIPFHRRGPVFHCLLCQFLFSGSPARTKLFAFAVFISVSDVPSISLISPTARRYTVNLSAITTMPSANRIV